MTEYAEVGDIVRKHGFPIGTEQIVKISSEYGVSTQIPQSTFVGAGFSQFIPHGDYDVVLKKSQFEFLMKVHDAIEYEIKIGR